MSNSIRKAFTAALVCGAGLLSAVTCTAATFNLTAAAFDKTVNLPGGGTRVVRMWGFALDSGSPSSPGPALTVPVGDTTLTINLTNNLPVPVSIVIPNQNGYVRVANEHSTFTELPPPDGQSRVRASSFVKEAPAGGSATYTWNNVTPGTYIYYSGSHAALQVQMGLYGVVTHDAAATEVYTGVNFGGEATWVFGEIDFHIHDAVAAGTYGPVSGATVKSMISIVPDVYLLNGDTYEAGQLVVENSTFPQLVRMVNACYEERVPIVNGYHLAVVAEDGRKYGYPKTENAIDLPSLKTRDALLTPAADATLPMTLKFYDRRQLR